MMPDGKNVDFWTFRDKLADSESETSGRRSRSAFVRARSSTRRSHAKKNSHTIHHHGMNSEHVQ